MGMQGDTYAAHQDLGKYSIFTHSFIEQHFLHDYHFVLSLQVVRVVVYDVSVPCHSYFVISVMSVITRHVMIIHIGYPQMNPCHPAWHHLKHVILPII